ncbi:MAG: ATP-binding protein [Burkholderiaceae bacterium]
MVHIPAPLPHNEVSRLDALIQLDILDTGREQGFDDIVTLASRLCDVPIALVSLIDSERQWFKACVGLDAAETHRDLAFCAHAILAPDEVLEVQDARLDPRFCESALVLAEPFIRFYAGAPITTVDGHTLGTVCVIDRVPRKLDGPQREALAALARQTASLLQLRTLLAQSEAQKHVLRERVTRALGSGDDAHRGLRHDHRVATVGYITASVAHDFNNLLQSLKMGIDLLRRKAHRPQDVERLAEGALKTVGRGASLIARMLAISRDEQPDTCPIAIVDRIEGMRPLLTSAVGASFQLQFDLQGRESEVLCDATQFEAAVLNLVVNARDAIGSSGGGIRISSRLTHFPDQDDLRAGTYLDVQVSDDGPGISSDVLQRVFEPFYTTKPEGEGTGLGLAQVLGFAQNSGGTARIQSSPQGTTVQMLLRPV